MVTDSLLKVSEIHQKWILEQIGFDENRQEKLKQALLKFNEGKTP